MNKIDIKNLSFDELEKELTKIGEKPYRAAQIFKWLYKTGVEEFDEMIHSLKHGDAIELKIKKACPHCGKFIDD